MLNASELNRDKLLKLLGILDEALAELTKIAGVEQKVVLASRDRFALEDLFYRLSMATIDICFHLVARGRGKVPGSYKECFSELAGLGFLEPDLADKLKALAGLRNVIAHLYWNIDYGQLYGLLSDLHHVTLFRDKVLRLIRQSSTTPVQ